MINPEHWAELKPGVVLVPTSRCASSALCQAVRLKQGRLFDPAVPQRGFASFRHVDYGLHLRTLPMETEFVIVGRHPIRRFESARHRLASHQPNAPTDTWERFIAWAIHATDSHVLPVTRLVDRYFHNRPHRLVRIEDYAQWGAELGLPATLPKANVSSTYERLPKSLIPTIVDLYREDFERLDYPLP